MLDEARKKAVADARRRAELYARAADVRLGRVRTISEQPINVRETRFMASRDGGKEMTSVPVATGEEQFRVIIHVVFGLEVEE